MWSARLLALGTVLVATLLGGPPGAAANAAADDLTEPLLVPDACGTGEDVHFTLATTGDTFPHENIQAVGEAQGFDVLFDYVRPFLQAT